MQIMEDVREGHDANPPSSPGHAEQRQGQEELFESHSEQEKNEDDQEEAKQENGVKEETEIECEESLIIKEEVKDDVQNGDNGVDKNEESSNQSSGSETNKRKLEEDEEPIKKLKCDIQDNFASRDKIMNDFIEVTECYSLEQIQSTSEQILGEIKTLNELAKEKEREWNHILHMKKLKEELLIRLQRRRQVLLINDGDLSDFQPENNGQHSVLKSNQKSNFLRLTNMDKLKQKIFQNKSSMEINSLLDFRKHRSNMDERSMDDKTDRPKLQRPTLDVQSIIADYRQRHPEAIPRRGRRIRQLPNEPPNYLDFSGNKSDSNSEIGMLLASLNGSRENSRSSFQDLYNQDNASYKDILVQFAKLSQNERTELQMQLQSTIKPPPPYPEVTVHPVTTTTSSVAPTNSLLHGILTKTPTRQTSTANNGSKTSFSPTLARLLTAPERTGGNTHITSTPTNLIGESLMNPSNMSISEILSGTKARNEITITPVGSQYDTTPTKGSSLSDSEETADRLVIDEASETPNSRNKDETGSENGEDVPQCQGCNQKAAQFVCAGCGNQWYCSRECQVASWDDHSEVCSG